jgi:N-acetylmuramoyl-L-alanine amidase
MITTRARRTFRLTLASAALAATALAVVPGPAHAAPTTTQVAAQTSTLLKVGARGPAVLELQNRLTSLGYWLGTPDGTYGELTRQAVMALQGAANLHRDGVVGPNTRAALDRGTQPTVSRTGHVVEIDRGAGTLTIADDGRIAAILHTSTGTYQTYRSPSGKRELADTPAGSFHVYRAVDGLRHAELGTLYRPRYFDPSQGIAVHGASSVPAYPASHGCARVTNAAMDMIWARNLMPKDALVVVR